MKTTFLCLGLLASLSVGLSGCKKQYPVVVPLLFLAPVTITPSARTMQLGDTLWLTACFSDSLLDYNSGKRYRIRPQDMTFVTGFAIKELQGIGQLPTGIANTVNVVAKVGQLSGGGTTTGRFSLVYDGARYQGKYGLIPTQRGVTAVSLLLSPVGGGQALRTYLPFIHLPPVADGTEQKALLEDMYFVINGGTANNYDLYSQHTKAYALDPGIDPRNLLYEEQSTFTVEVN